LIIINKESLTFIKFPNYLVWNHQDSTNTLLREYGDKILHILSYLDCCTSRVGNISFSIEDIIITCGLVPKSGKGNVNEQFRIIIVNLVDKCILQIKNDKNIDTCKIGELIRCDYNPFTITEDLKGWFPVYHDNYLKIINDDDNTDINKLVALKIYYYILARLNRRDTHYTTEGEKLTSNIVITGGKAEVFWDGYNSICEDLNITDNTLNKYLKYLKSLNLIYYDNVGMVQKDDVKKQANNVYAIDETELEYGLKQSELWYEDKGYIGVDGENDRAIRGLKGKIQAMKNKGKDTAKLERKLGKKLDKLKPKKDMTIEELRDELNIRYKNILEIDDAYSLDLNIKVDWREYLPWGDVTDDDYKNVLEKIISIESEMNKALGI